MTRAPLPLAPVLMYLRKSHIIAYISLLSYAMPTMTA